LQRCSSSALQPVRRPPEKDHNFRFDPGARLIVGRRRELVDQVAKSPWLRIQSVSHVFALTLTLKAKSLTSELQEGKFHTRAEAISELERRALISWNEEPNRAPCTNWRNCGRRYVILEWNGAGDELSRESILGVCRRRVWSGDRDDLGPSSKIHGETSLLCSLTIIEG
jgi:hypothetical protein